MRSTISSSRSARWAATSIRRATGTISSRSATSSRACSTTAATASSMPGMVGYFPEAVYYGPQSQDPSITCKTIVLQFGGASGSGYLSRAEVHAGMKELAQANSRTACSAAIPTSPASATSTATRRSGSTATGGRWSIRSRATRADLHGSRPTTRGWRSTTSRASTKGSSVSLPNGAARRASLRLETGAEFTARGKGVLVVVRGAGTIGDQPMRALTTVHLEAGKSVALEARGADRVAASCAAGSRRSTHAGRTTEVPRRSRGVGAQTVTPRAVDPFRCPRPR